MKITSRLVLAVAALFVLTACEDDPVSPVNEGRIRAVHAMYDFAAMDVLLGTAVYKDDLAYKGTDGYSTSATGTVAVKFRGPTDPVDVAVANTSVADGVDYTVVAFGTEAAPQTMVLTDNNAAPAAGKAKFRLAHAAAVAEALDVYVLAAAGDLETATPDHASLQVKTASPYIEKNAGTYVVIFTAAGTKTPALTMNGVQVAAGNIRTILAVEKAGGGTPLEGVTLADK